MMRKLRDVIANRTVISAAASQSVTEAARLMTRYNIGSVLVMDGKRLYGIFTERDIITRVVSEGRDPNNTKIAEVMTPNPVVMAVDKSFTNALVAMAEGKFRHMPVLDGYDVIGVVSMRDALGVEHEAMDRLLQAFNVVTNAYPGNGASHQIGR
jgi:CBS domain-containing protein